MCLNWWNLQSSYYSTSIRTRSWHLEIHRRKLTCALREKKNLHFIWVSRLLTTKQSHYREVPRWEIFVEQELRFGLDLGWMATFPAFIASESFDLLSHHIPQKCFYNLWHIFMYQKIYEILKNTLNFYRLRNIFNCVLPH